MPDQKQQQSQESDDEDRQTGTDFDSQSDEQQQEQEQPAASHLIRDFASIWSIKTKSTHIPSLFSIVLCGCFSFPLENSHLNYPFRWLFSHPLKSATVHWQSRLLCPYSLMDKTRGFYPFDLGSIPSGGTEAKQHHSMSGVVFRLPGLLYRCLVVSELSLLLVDSLSWWR